MTTRQIVMTDRSPVATAIAVPSVYTTQPQLKRYWLPYVSSSLYKVIYKYSHVSYMYIFIALSVISFIARWLFCRMCDAKCQSYNMDHDTIPNKKKT